jgi:hypothetical protein
VKLMMEERRVNGESVAHIVDSTRAWFVAQYSLSKAILAKTGCSEARRRCQILHRITCVL